MSFLVIAAIALAVYFYVRPDKFELVKQEIRKILCKPKDE